jgi:hypothetical protein
MSLRRTSCDLQILIPELARRPVGSDRFRSFIVGGLTLIIP